MDGADAMDGGSDGSARTRRLLMGIADAACGGRMVRETLAGGEGDRSAGEATELGTMSSSMLTTSRLLYSELWACAELRFSCWAIPLGRWVPAAVPLDNLKVVCMSKRASRRPSPMDDLPRPFLLLPLQIHGHHPPRQIVHSLLVWQLSFGTTE